jgi:nucleoid DNA-binding protein/nucleoid-associated protein YgaU
MNIKLTLQEIIDKLSERSGKSKKTSENFLRILMEVVEEGLRKDGIAKVKGIGTFKIVAIEQRKSVNVQDGTEYIIPAHNKISFIPEKNLKEEINQPYAHLETYTLSDDAPIEVTPDDDDELLSDTSSDDEKMDIDIDEKIATDTSESKETKFVSDVENEIENNIKESNTETVKTEIETITTSENNSTEEPKNNDFIINQEINNTMEEKLDNGQLSEDIENSSSIEDTSTLVENNSSEESYDRTENIDENITKVSSTLSEENNPNEIVSEEDKNADENSDNQENIEEKDASEEVVSSEKQKKKGKGILFAILLLLLLLTVGYFALKHFNLLGNGESEQSESVLPPQELVESETQEVNQEEIEGASEEDLFLTDEGEAADYGDAEQIVTEEPQSGEQFFTEEESSEPVFKEATETKSFDNELIKFMAENHPELNFPSSCAIKNEVTMTNGNRLTLVSLKNYGHKNFWVYIYYFNKDIISNPNNVPIGAKIKVPDLNSSIVNPDSEECMKAVSNINQQLINK